ncbi:MAG TPA: pyrroline-5-carboxylate reductase [Chromatiales bacterium]|nr:pyrroline-5-carboxylate reductase [Chromatiales bacterium]
MKSSRITFIGGGNMAGALVTGLIADGYPQQLLTVSEPDEEKRLRLSSRLGIETTDDNAAAVANADVVVLAVKPQILKEVVTGIAETARRHRPLFISIAAGVRESDLDRWLGGETALVRAMPNTPAMIQSGATVLHANQRVSSDQRELAESILRAVGIALWVDDESLIDAATALSGSGPAYFFLVMEAMEEAGTAMGLEPDTARLLTLQTALGAARVALESSDPPAVLRQKVTSPGGTTEQALKVMQEGGLPELIIRALQAARERSITLSRQLGDDQ